MSVLDLERAQRNSEGSGRALMTDIVSAVGKAFGSRSVMDVLNSLASLRVVEDPPFRTYVGSPAQGLDLLVENDRVLSVQIYTQATRTFSPFLGVLPFGLLASMKQSEVHALLGAPLQSSNVSSKFVLMASSISLVVTYDDRLSIRLLSIAPIE